MDGSEGPTDPSEHAEGTQPIPPLEPETVTKKELVARIAEKTRQTKVVAKDIIQMFLDEIIDELSRGNRLEFREFGVFEVKERAARRAQNPRTLEKVEVPAKWVVKFKVGRLMKECVAEGQEAHVRRYRQGRSPYPERTYPERPHPQGGHAGSGPADGRSPEGPSSERRQEPPGAPWRD